MKKVFTLRWLMFFVAIASCFFGWLGLEIQQSLVQQNAVEAILTTGGRVNYDPCYFTLLYPNAFRTRREDSRFRKLLRRTFGDTACGRVKCVTFGSNTRDADVQHLRRLPSVQTVVFVRGTTLSKAIIRGLAEHRGVNDVSIYRCNITNDVYATLSTCNNIELLSIVPPTTMRKVPLEFVRGLGNLKVLWIEYAALRSKDLEHVRSPEQVEAISLARSTLDDGIMQIGRFKKLQELRLNGIHLKSCELEMLSKLDKLSVLSLNYTNVSDQDIEMLSKMRNLKLLMIVGSRITQQGVKSLRTLLPQCNVVSSIP